ncbi:unnamed protein product [Calypogeia fissa]
MDDSMGQHIQHLKANGSMAEELTRMGSPKIVANGKTGEDGLQPLPEDTRDAVVKSNAPEGAQGMVSFLQLYSFADKYDYALMFFGTIGGIVHGVSVPLVLWLFGEFLNAIGQGRANLMQTVDKLHKPNLDTTSRWLPGLLLVLYMALPRPMLL